MGPLSVRFFLGLLCCLACEPARAQAVESESEAASSGTKASLSIESSVGDGPWRKTKGLSIGEGERIRLRVPHKGEGASVAWYLVFPDLSKTYKNANHPWEPDPYKWVGYADIDYYRIELEQFRGQWTIAPFGGQNAIWAGVRQWLRDRGEASKVHYYHDDAGTFRFQAIVRKDGQTWRTAGLEDTGKLGISKQVLRVSRRKGEGYPGHLTAYFNVPGLFGSVTAQSQHYIGVDCADVLVASHTRWRKRSPKKNYNVAMLVAMSRPLAELDLDGNMLSAEPVWGKDIRPGDFVAVRYEGASRYQHIGALLGDTDGDGVLGAKDVVLHAGPWPLQESQLGAGPFQGHLVIFRPPKNL